MKIMLNSVKKLSALISVSQRNGLIFLTILLFIGMIFEILGLGLIIPLLESIVDPEKIKNTLDSYIGNGIIHNISDKKLIYYLLFVVFFVYLSKSCFLILLNYLQNKLTSNINTHISTNLFSKYLQQDYQSFILHHSSFYTKNLQVEITTITNLLSAIVTIIIEFFLISSAVLTLLVIEPLGAILISSFFLSFAFLYSNLTKGILKSWSERMLDIQTNISKKIIDGFGGFIEFKVLNKNDYIISLFKKNLQEKTIIRSKYLTLQQTPRHLLELISILGLIGFILFLLLNDYDIKSIISIVGVFVAATFRMIPSLNRLLTAIQHLKHDKISLDLIFNEFKRINSIEYDFVDVYDKIKFIKEIKINSIYLNFEKKIIFNDFNLSIDKGSKVGIMGPSGSGKSSLMKILLGMLNPSKGEILVDGNNIKENLNGWRNSIGYVPQDIFLMDDSIKSNIALGVIDEKIDTLRVKECVKLAELDKYIESLPLGLNTPIGERGVKISGGQKQRIGIARALYNTPEILIFDEATSALDEKTETLVMNTIYNLDKSITIILISHNEKTLKKCDKLIRL